MHRQEAQIKGFEELEKCHRVINVWVFTRRLKGDFIRAHKYSH